MFISVPVVKNCVECNWKHWEGFEDRNNSLLFCLPVLCTGIHMCVHTCTHVCAHAYMEPVVDDGCLPVFLDSFVLEIGPH